MKRLFLILSASLLTVGAVLRAEGVALIYENEEAVKAGRSWTAPIGDGGAALSAKSAMAAANTLFYGDAEGLFRGEIARMDMDLDIAVVRRTERVGNSELQAKHQARWQGSAGFLRVATAAAPGVVTVAPTAVGGAPFLVKINGQVPGETPLLLKSRFKKSKFKFEVVNLSSVPVWNATVELTSDPSLSFWKEGRRTGLNDVPEKRYTYSYQALIKPLKTGAAFSVPVEVYFIKERDYVLTFKVESKGVQHESKALVRFE